MKNAYPLFSNNISQNFESIGIRHILFAVIILMLVIIPVQYVSAIPTVTWQFPNGYSMIDGGPISSRHTVQFTITDPLLQSNGRSDTISAVVNSTSFPTGITLTLQEIGDTGVFKNTNLIFTDGNGLYSTSDTVTVSITDSSLNTDPLTIDSVISGPGPPSNGIKVVSDSDVSTGMFLNLTETGQNTGVFTNKLHFTTGSSVNGSSIKVRGGDIFSILYFKTLGIQSGIITPNPDPALGALPAKFNDTISVAYQGVKATTKVNGTWGPGGGGGGLIRPGLVLDIIAGIGGSPYVVQPPSFGGLSYHFADGLTFTQGNNKTVHDISHYNQELPRQVMVTGEKVSMTFKTFESYYSEGVIHMGLYLIPRGHDMITPKSIASIEWDKGKPVTVADPNHILSNVNASSSSDGKFQYTKFVFTPEKSYDKMSFLVRAWNDHRYSTDTRIHDAIDIPQIINSTLPQGTIKYDNFADLQQALHKDQFYKPEILSRIHNTDSVFPSQQGKVYWLYDTVNHFVTLVVSDENDNELFSHKSPLQPYTIEKEGDYKFMYFTVKQLDRWDTDQIQNALKAEEEKALSVAIEKRIIPQSNW